MTWRYVAERVRTGQLLDLDLDFVPDGPPSRELSGPGSLTGTMPLQEDPTVASDGQPIVDDWSTGIYAELNGRIAWGGLVTDTAPAGDRLKVTVTGFTGYPPGQPFLGVFGNRGAEDAFDIVRAIWSHLQGFATGNLRLVVDGQKAGVSVGNVGSPYGLVWWDPQDCGNEIDELAKSTPFDYVEEHTWNADRTAITHRLRLAFPRMGTRRDDLRFAAGENIRGQPEPERLTDEYANELYAIGKGEGVKSERASLSMPDGLRVRRCVAYTDKARTSAQLNPIIRRELAARRAEWQVPSITVDDHQNAALGSWQLGDDIPVTLDQPFLPRTTVWHRVVGDQIDHDAGVAVLSLVRSDAFTT